MPRVSVVMSVHNGARHLGQALAAILGQRFTDLEFIVIDDGSTDQTPRMLAAINDPRMRIIRQQRTGLTASLVNGVALARGEYVARQDADDISEPQRLERQVAFLDSHREVAIVGSAVSVIDEAGRRLCDWSYPAGHDALVAELKRLRTPLPHSTVMFRRAAALAAGNYRAVFRKAQDYDLLLRLAQTHRLASIADKLCRLRLCAGSVTSGRGEDEQFYFAVMALMAAVIRHQTGRDPLDGPQREPLIARFDGWYRAHLFSRRFDSRLARRQMRIALARRHFPAALGCLLKATTADPGWLGERWWNRPRELREVGAWVQDQLRTGLI